MMAPADPRRVDPARFDGARFDSVDAMRGLTVAAMLLVNTPGDWNQVYAPLLHAPWHGFTPTDLVFPMFLFIVGVSVALGIVPKMERGMDRRPLRAQVLRRATRIVVAGLVLHLLAWIALDMAAFRPFGVLQRIGVCFAACGLLALHATPRVQAMVVVALLSGYCALLAAGGVEPVGNLPGRVDAALLGPHAYRFDPASGIGYDPEGLLSTMPAIATTLLGLRAGAWLRAGATGRLLAAAAALLAGGALWSLALPLNKALWTPSYVLWCGGWSMLALVAMHHAIDRGGWPAIGRSLGRNAIVVYAGSALMLYAMLWLGALEPIYRVAFEAVLAPRAGPRMASLAFALAFVALWWAIAGWMQRRGWRIVI